MGLHVHVGLDSTCTDLEVELPRRSRAGAQARGGPGRPSTCKTTSSPDPSQLRGVERPHDDSTGARCRTQTETARL